MARKHQPELAMRRDATAHDAAEAVDDSGEMVAALRLLSRRQSGVRATMSRALAALARAMGEAER
ncbi:MAG TPA: hypothetical protein VKB62_04435 [Streptosporangiaceae bacterium]|nr:hypothetical protein [Streptosporangiaceae bacterium]